MTERPPSRTSSLTRSCPPEAAVMFPDGFDQQRHPVGDADCLCTLSHPVTLRKPTRIRALIGVRRLCP
jgi:hypothetical protein